MIELRDYQLDGIERIRGAYRAGARSVLLVSPTGSGKTVLFAFVVAGALARGSRVWIIAHRAELLGQISRALAQFCVPHGFIAAGMPLTHEAVQVCSVQTLVRRLPRLAPPDLIVQDEAHHLAAANSWGQVHAFARDARRLGVTATPVRLDGQGLGAFFEAMVVGPSTQALIDRGYLAPLRVFAPAVPDVASIQHRGGDYVARELMAVVGKPVITGSAVQHYTRHAAHRRALVFCVSITHAQAVAAQFRAAGYGAACIDGKMDKDLRSRVLAAFASAETPVLTSCDLVSEGFDLPAIECAISLRPTMSLGLWLQQVGRALRPAPSKTHALLLDHAGNSLRLGLPTDEQEWSLAAGVVTRRARDGAGVRVCSACFAASSPRALVCSECGASFPVKPREVEEVPGELTEQLSEGRRSRMAQGQLKTLASLIELGRKRGYRAPEYWARRVLAGRAAKGTGTRA